MKKEAYKVETIVDAINEIDNTDKDRSIDPDDLEKIKKASLELQDLTGVKVTRSMICKGVFAKPNHIFYIAKSRSGVECRFEIPTSFEKEFNEFEIVREVINDFGKRMKNVN